MSKLTKNPNAFTYDNVIAIIEREIKEFNRLQLQLQFQGDEFTLGSRAGTIDGMRHIQDILIERFGVLSKKNG